MENDQNNTNNLQNQTNNPLNPAPITPPTPVPAPAPSVEPEPVAVPIPDDPTKKKLKTRLICIIAAVVVLIGGGGAFTALAIIKNRPENAAIEAFSNLTNANQIAIDGTTSIKVNFPGYDTIDLNFNTEKADSNQRTNLSAKLTLTDGNSIDLVNIGEVMLKSGVFYLKIDNLTELYNNYLKEMVSSYIQSLVSSQISREFRYKCIQETHNDYEQCYYYSSSPEVKQLTSERSAEILKDIDNLVSSIDGSWFEFSIEEILNSDFIANKLSIPALYRQGINSAYNCAVDTINDFPKYATNLSDYYNKYPFITFSKADDNYYNLSANPTTLTDFVNNAENNISLYDDIIECVYSSFGSSSPYGAYKDYYEMTVEDAETIIENLPQIAIRYDGFLNHHLTDIDIKSESPYYSMSSHVSFSYPNNLQVSAPEEYHPIIEPIEKIYELVTTKIYSY